MQRNRGVRHRELTPLHLPVQLHQVNKIFNNLMRVPECEPPSSKLRSCASNDL